MTPAEAAAILTIAAAYDNRKPDADQAKAWAMALDGLKFEDCRQIVVEHYRKSRDWLMPVDVISGVKRMRSARVLKFGGLHNPPAEVADDPNLYRKWHHETMTAIGDGTLEGPTVTSPAEIQSRDVMGELGNAGRPVADALTDDPTHARAAARRAMQDGRQVAQAKPEPRPAPTAACEAQTTEGGGIVICGEVATATAAGDLRDYPACADHAECLPTHTTTDGETETT